MFAKHKKIIIVLIVIAVICAIWSIWYVGFLNKAHSTFDNYYAFRGCTELLEKTDNYGICKVAPGETIKIVKYQNKWFLDGDLPSGWLNIL